MSNVTPPPMARVPQNINKELAQFLTDTNRILLQLWQRTGGATDAIEDNPAVTANDIQISRLKGDINALQDALRALEIDTHTITLDDIYKRLNTLEQEIHLPPNLDDINQRLESLEAQI